MGRSCIADQPGEQAVPQQLLPGGRVARARLGGFARRAWPEAISGRAPCLGRPPTLAHARRSSSPEGLRRPRTGPARGVHQLPVTRPAATVALVKGP